MRSNPKVTGNADRRKYLLGRRVGGDGVGELGEHVPDVIDWSNHQAHGRFERRLPAGRALMTGTGGGMSAGRNKGLGTTKGLGELLGGCIVNGSFELGHVLGFLLFNVTVEVGHEGLKGRLELGISKLEVLENLELFLNLEKS